VILDVGENVAGRMTLARPGGFCSRGFSTLAPGPATLPTGRREEEDNEGGR